MIEALEHGITCIDTGYMRPGLAASYLVRDGEEVAIVETGTPLGVPRILRAMAACGVAPESVRYVIPTHVHLDHAGGAGALLGHCRNATLLVHPRGLRHLVDPARLVAGAIEVYGAERFARLYGEVIPAAADRVREAPDGSRWALGSRTLLVRDTPGHARHHFCVWDERSRGWFSGDTFGIAYPELRFRGRPFLLPTTTPVQFEPEALHASIDLLMDAEPACFYLTHFGRIVAEAAHAAALHAEIDAYVAISAAVAAGADARPALRARLEAHTIARLRAAGCAWREAPLRRFLALDMDLNVDGILSWRGRR
jgi:glyoxylase-like metal-dependent hydrolase (beta-lactamase superfamily II)